MQRLFQCSSQVCSAQSDSRIGVLGLAPAIQTSRSSIDINLRFSFEYNINKTTQPDDQPYTAAITRMSQAMSEGTWIERPQSISRQTGNVFVGQCLPECPLPPCCSFCKTGFRCLYMCSKPKVAIPSVMVGRMAGSEHSGRQHDLQDHEHQWRHCS